MKRSSGILMPIFSLSSPHGIGTLGKAAYDFVDFLVSAGQSWWQILPVGPTSYGDSPYQSFSTYAGNPYFVDLDLLCQDGLLTQEEIDDCCWGKDPARVAYETIYQSRFAVLKLAADRAWKRDGAAIAAFETEQKDWLPDYALFMALKRHFGMQSWEEWPDEAIRLREKAAMEQYRKLLSDDIHLFVFIQYAFFRQWEALRAYAAEKGIGIIGDLPIYVAMDSADVWAEPEYFQLDEARHPTEVAGVPPDYFSEDGQLWGNPLYNWKEMKARNYDWWIRRIGGAARLYDVLRIDHFRGFESYWAVPAGASTAKKGHWVKGPGLELIYTLTGWFSDMQFIAEDLGILTEDVHIMLKDSGLPGMKVLEFAFDPTSLSDYLPHTYTPNCVCYAGTHDNAPLEAWREEADAKEIAFAKTYLGITDDELFCRSILQGGLRSVADLFVAQMQDYLGLGAESRINTPGILGGNWQWRLLPGQLTDEVAAEIFEMTRIYGRVTTEDEEKDE